jgi:hypothetical protein
VGGGAPAGDGSKCLKPFDRLEARPDDFDPEVRDRLLSGAMIPGIWYVRAQRFRRWFQERVRRLFEEVDVILAPATPVSAPRIGQKIMVLGGEEMLVRPNIGIYTQPISFVGLPVVAVPLFGVGPLPIGVQVIAAPGARIWPCARGWPKNVRTAPPPANAAAVRNLRSMMNTTIAPSTRPDTIEPLPRIAMPS